MSYRKITVDGKEYEYSIGRTHVKIKGVGVWLKEEVGENFAKICGCGCGEPVDTIYSQEKLTEHDYTIRVHPKHIAEKIRKEV
jgi:uncharacterized protein YacL (UPF0231 family)